MNEHENKPGSLSEKALRVVKQNLKGGGGGGSGFEQTLHGELECVAERDRKTLRHRDSARSLARDADPGGHVEPFGWRSTDGARRHDLAAAQGLPVACRVSQSCF